MRKPRDMSLKHFAAPLTEINNFLPFFLGYDPTKKIPAEELNEILPYVVPNRWKNQPYI